MGFFRWPRRGAEAVANPQPAPEARAGSVPRVYSSDPSVSVLFGGSHAFTDEVVTVETALQIPAIWCAVSFLSRTLAALPLKVFEKSKDSRDPKPDHPAQGLLSFAANDETSAFDFRRAFWQDVFTIGRGLAFMERNGRGELINLWPLVVQKTTVERRRGRTLYHYQDGGRRVTYQAAEILDLAFMPGADRLSARSPIYTQANTIGLARAVTRYGARFFNNGGVPPFTISGPFGSADAMERAAADLSETVQKTAEDGGNAIPLPDGHKIDKLGFNPEDMQMDATQKRLIFEVARIYGIPPMFLQDLTYGTFSNSEQQDIQLVKHVISQWAGAFEGEANLKLFGRKGGGQIFAEHVLDGLMRGDALARAAANRERLNTGQITINEARALENRPPVPGGDVALVQGAMIPVDQAGKAYGADGSGEGDEANEGQDDE